MLQAVLTSVLTLVCASEESADGVPAVPTDVLVSQSLQHSLLDEGFAGVVSFDVETFCGTYALDADADSATSTKRVEWTFTTDGEGNMRVKSTGYYGKGPVTMMAGRTPKHIWTLMGGDLRVFADDLDFDNLVIKHPHVNKQNFEINHRVAEMFLAEAEAKLGTVLGPPISGLMKTLMIDRSPTTPGVVVNTEFGVTTVCFERVGNELRVREEVRSRDDFTFRWTYSDHFRVDEHWVPGSATLQQVTESQPAKSKLKRYTGISVTPAPDHPSTDRRFAAGIPKRGDLDIGQVAIVLTVSNDGVSYHTFGAPSTAKPLE